MKTRRALENYKKIGFTRQKGSHNNHMPQYEKMLTFSRRAIENTFKKDFANLASDLVKTRYDPTRKLGIASVHQVLEES